MVTGLPSSTSMFAGSWISLSPRRPVAFVGTAVRATVTFFGVGAAVVCAALGAGVGGGAAVTTSVTTGFGCGLLLTMLLMTKIIVTMATAADAPASQTKRGHFFFGSGGVAGTIAAGVGVLK